jgi:CysZ protein
MPNALRLAFHQMTDDPAIRRVLWISFAATIALVLTLPGLAGWGLAQVQIANWSWIDTTLDVLGGVAVLALGILLFPAIVGLVAGLFLDSVADAVEARHYPALPPPRRQGIGEMIWGAARFFVVLVAVNLVAVGIVLIVPGVNLLVFWVVNGYLLGREYFELVAARRMEPAAMQALWREHRGRFIAAGLVLAVILMIPIVNLIVPVLGAAFVTHVFHRAVPAGSGRPVARGAAG